MPVIAVNLSANVFGRVLRLVEGGLYASTEQFLDVAACNQLALESGVTPTELIEKDHRKPFPVEDAPLARVSKEPRSATARHTRARNAQRRGEGPRPNDRVRARRQPILERSSAGFPYSDAGLHSLRR